MDDLPRYRALIGHGVPFDSRILTAAQRLNRGLQSGRGTIGCNLLMIWTRCHDLEKTAAQKKHLCQASVDRLRPRGVWNPVTLFRHALGHISDDKS